MCCITGDSQPMLQEGSNSGLYLVIGALGDSSTTRLKRNKGTR